MTLESSLPIPGFHEYSDDLSEPCKWQSHLTVHTQIQIYEFPDLMKSVGISRSKYHRCLPVDDVHDHRPYSVDEEVVAVYASHPAGCHLKQEGALLWNKLKHLS